MKSFLAIVLAMCAGASLAQKPPKTADKKQLDELGGQYAVAKTTYKKKPTPANRHNLVIATDKLATATMTSEALDARVRYPKALELYNEALVLEPKNEEAKNNAGMIDSVYHGMIVAARRKLKQNPTDAGAAAQLARFTSIYGKMHRPLP